MRLLVAAAVLLVLLVAAGFAWSAQSRSKEAPFKADPAAAAQAPLERAQQDVARMGWHVVAVPGELSDHGYLFTVGLWQSYRHPELILFSGGKDPMRVASSLAQLVERVRGGEKLEVGKRYDAAFNQFPAALREVESRWVPELMGAAVGFYGQPSFPVLQVFWPDKSSRFPWESDFDLELFRAQPLLMESNLALAGLPWDTLEAIERSQGLAPFRAAVDELLVKEQPGQLEAALEGWSWLIGDKYELLAITVFGDVFLKAPSGAVSVLLIDAAEHFVIAKDEDEWLRRAARGAQVLFHAPLLRQLRALKVDLEPGMVYDFIHDLSLGGQQTVDNVQWISAVVRLSRTGRKPDEASAAAPPSFRGPGGAVLPPDSVFAVVINDEEQYSMWPAGRDLPKGWKAVGVTGAQQECLDYIEKVWTDMRPKSLREKLGGEEPP